MKLLIDCDVLLDVGLRREPHFEASARIHDWAERNPGRTALAWHNVANLDYIIRGGARDFIESFSQFIEVPETGTHSLEFALSLKMSDFEDALQVAAAERFGAQVIVTRNIKHYSKSPIRAIKPVELLELITH